jgi:hypothetical protein
MLLSPFLTVSALAGLALATTNEEYCAAARPSRPRYPTRPRSTIQVGTAVTAVVGGANAQTGDPLYIKGKYHYRIQRTRSCVCGRTRNPGGRRRDRTSIRILRRPR